mgnify:CR=1 FL=1
MTLTSQRKIIKDNHNGRQVYNIKASGRDHRSVDGPLVTEADVKKPMWQIPRVNSLSTVTQYR